VSHANDDIIFSRSAESNTVNDD